MKSFDHQTALETYTAERYERQLQEARNVVSKLDGSILTQPRPGGKWSVAALFDHMNVMNRLYGDKVDAVIAAASESARRDWSPTLAGRILRWAVNTHLELPTVSNFVPPNPISEPAGVDRFLAGLEALISLQKRSSDLHWKSVRVSSPASQFVRLNLGDVFLVLADHTDRHLRQIGEYVRSLSDHSR